MSTNGVDRQQADLKGRSVFVVGSQYYTKHQRENLVRAGATVTCCDALGGNSLTRRGDEALAAREILARHPRPDAVIVHHPRMDLHDGALDAIPAVSLARTLRAHGIPTLIIDAISEKSAVVTELMRRTGTTFYRLESLPAQRVPNVIEGMLADQERQREMGPGRT